MSRAREVARQAVTRVRERDAYAHETLDSLLKNSRLDERDAAFATRLAYGTIACRGTLDDAIKRHVSNPGSLEPLVSDALAVSAYEILWTATPGRAAVNEGVELVRAVQPRAAGFANAVLRKLLSAAPAFPWGDPANDNGALARKYGHPRWLAEMWIMELGRDIAEQVMAADNEPAPLFLAHLPFRSTEPGVMESLRDAGAEPVACEVSEGCILVAKAASARHASVVTDRDAIVVDAGAQLAASVVRPGPSDTVVEIGAGRGSKSLLLAAGMHRRAAEADVQVTGSVIAVDSHDFKLKALRSTADELGIPYIRTVAADVTDPSTRGMLPEPGTVDAVLVDAPCSGLGTLRRHPDRRWRATSAEVDALADLGERLLTVASRLVKPGGFVVYSTCTIARRENREVVEHFLGSDDGRDFSLDSLESDVPDDIRRFVGETGMFQSLPEMGGMDGHFVARLRRA